MLELAELINMLGQTLTSGLRGWAYYQGESMIRRVLFAAALIILAVGFYYSQNFELIAAGVATLLFGMKFLETGFESIAAGPLYSFMQKIGQSFWLSFFLGLTSTAVLQSSSLITIIAITFLSTGLLSLRSGLGIIFGTNLGTTSTAWIVAAIGLKVNLSGLALPMVVFGVMFLSGKAPLQKALGNVLLGLGAFFMGIFAMQLGFADLQGQAFQLSQVSSRGVLALSVLSGMVLTAVLQSSSATMAIILTALAAGQITFEQSLALAIGANVGTSFTAVLGSLSTSINGKRLAAGHLLFNLITGVLALLLLPLFVILVDRGADLLDLEEGGLAIQLALFHTIFNLFGVLIMLPWTGRLERLLYTLINWPEKRTFVTEFLEPGVLQVPQAGYSALHQECRALLVNLSQFIRKNIAGLKRERRKGFLQQFISDAPENIQETYYREIKPVLAEVQSYASRLSGAVKTDNFSIASRLIAEIVRDFHNLQKHTGHEELMNNPAFVEVYLELVEQLDRALAQIPQLLDETNQELVTTAADTLNQQADQNNADIMAKVNRGIFEERFAPMAGTTLLHNADYIRDIIRKSMRVVKLLSSEQLLEKEVLGELEKKLQE